MENRNIKLGSNERQDISPLPSLDSVLLTTDYNGLLIIQDPDLPFRHLNEISADLQRLIHQQPPFGLDVKYGQKTYRVRGKKNGKFVSWHFTDISDLLAKNSSASPVELNPLDSEICHFAHTIPGSGKYPRCEIAKNELNLRLVLEESNQYIAVFNKDLSLAYFNGHYARALYENEGVHPSLGEQVLAKLPKEQFELWQTWFERALQGEVLSFEVAYQGKKGELIYLDNYLKPLLIDGHIRGVMQFTTDVTEKKRLGKHLVETEERLRMATESAHIGIFDWRYKAQELVWDKKSQEMFSADQQLFTAELKNSIQNQQAQDPVTPDNPYFSFESVMPVGKEFKHIKSYGRIMYDEHDQPERVIGINQDFSDYRRTEASYRESKIHLRAVFDSSTNAHYLIDEDYKLLSFNKVGSELIREVYGDHPSEGGLFLDYILSDQRSGFLTQFHKALNEENIQRLIKLNIPGKGERWFSSRFKPAYYEGQMIGVIFSTNDITPQIAAEKENQRLLKIICDSPTEVYLINQQNYCVEFVNEEVINNIQWGSEELKQKKFYDLQPTLGKRGFAHIIERLEKNPRKKIQYKTLQQRRDGSAYDVEVYLQKAGEAADNSLLAFVVDITETEKIQSNLRDIEHNYKLLIDNIPGFVTLLDVEGNLLFKNRPNNEQLIGAVIEHDLILDTCRGDHFNRLLRDAIDKQCVSEFESQIMSGTQKIWLIHQLVPIIKDKLTSQIMMISTDITAHKNQELQLRQSIEERDTLLKEIHHRVKNNLQIISSIIYLKSSQLDDPQSRLVMDECKQRIRSMHMIHEQLLKEKDLYNIDPGLFLEKLVSQVYQSFHLPEKEIEVECEIEHIRIGVNKVMSIAMIVYELLSNALLHAFMDRKKGKIIIRLKSSDSCINLCIIDNGKGMNVNKDRKEEGLGILLVKTFATQIKAQMKINSSEEGTHFCIQLNEQT